MLERAEAEKLRALEEYLDVGIGQNTEPNIQDVIGPWQAGRFKLFMSHITKDKLFVAEAKKELEKYGIDCFVAHEDIEPTKAWMDEIINALDSCDALAAFITPEYHDSLWTDQEVGYCIRRRILIVPVGLGKTPYGFMGKYQGVQCKGKKATEIAPMLADILIKNQKTQARMASALVAQVEDANSFDSAAQRARQLSSVSQWQPELLRRLQFSLENNSQVADSFVAAPIIKNILKENTF